MVLNNTLISDYIEKSIQTKKDLLDQCLPEIIKIANELIIACKKGNTIFWFGNGGSAADAQHLACELVSRFFLERRALSSIALTTNTSELTAIANDYDFNTVFSRQIEALVKPGDVVIGISTSGNSQNIITAFLKAKQLRATTIGFTGVTGGKIDGIVDYILKVPSNITPHIQESHIMVGHVLCYLIEKDLFENNGE